MTKDEQAQDSKRVGDSGKHAVRTHLLDVVDAAGLRRAKGQTMAQHHSMLDRLVDRLAYMTPANLDTLAETCLDNGAGPKRDEWPSEVLVRAWAQALQARPFEEQRIVSSWLASVEGPLAEAGGWLVELYRHLRRSPRPPSAYDTGQMRAEARENHRRITLIRERMAVDRAGAEDRAWLETYLADQRRAMAIVDAGKAARLAPTDPQQGAA